MRDETITTAERWKYNVPADRRSLSSRSHSLGLLAAVGLALALIGLGALAHGQVLPLGITPPQPVLADVEAMPRAIVFTARGCAPCAELKQHGWTALRGCRVQFVEHGTSEYAEALAEFEQAVPADPQGRNFLAGYCGPAPARPAEFLVPAIWIPGAPGYWTGYSAQHREALSQWTKQQLRIVVPSVVGPLPQAERLPQPFPTTFDARQPPRETFDGVVLIAVLAELSERHAAERAAMARRVDRALQELAESSVGSKVRAYFVARVADPETFDRLAALTGLDPSAPSHRGPPAALHVLIPERYHGMKALIVKRVEKALEAHFLHDLRQAHLNVILQRLDGGTYEACIAAVVARPEPTGEEEGPFDPFLYFACAWLAERSDLARRILERCKLA